MLYEMDVYQKKHLENILFSLNTLIRHKENPWSSYDYVISIHAADGKVIDVESIEDAERLRDHINSILSLEKSYSRS